MKIVYIVFFSLVCCSAKLPDTRDMSMTMDMDIDMDLEKFGKILGENRTELKSLSPEKLKKEMESLVARIDLNNDDLLDKAELIDWLQKVEDMNQQREADLVFLKEDKDDDGNITLEEYWIANEAGGFPKNEDDMTEAQLVIKTRFNAADLDKNNGLNMNEFGPFVYPYRHKYMIDSQISIYDSNKDGVISQDEFLKSFGQDGKELNESPEWIEHEKKQFEEVYDKNGDRELDRDEIEDWVASFEGKFKEEEASHLLKKADRNKDGFLSLQEVQAAIDTFVDSAVTDFGYSIHDEL